MKINMKKINISLSIFLKLLTIIVLLIIIIQAIRYQIAMTELQQTLAGIQW